MYSFEYTIHHKCIHYELFLKKGIHSRIGWYSKSLWSRKVNTKKNTSVFKKINTRTFEYKDGKTCIQKRINLEK